MTIYFCLWSQLPTIITIRELNQKYWSTLRISSASMAAGDTMVFIAFSDSHLPLWSFLPLSPIFPWSFSYLAPSDHTLFASSHQPGKYSLVPDAQGNILWLAVGSSTISTRLFVCWWRKNDAAPLYDWPLWLICTEGAVLFVADEETHKVITIKTDIPQLTCPLISPLLHHQLAENNACSTPKRPQCL